MNVLLDNFKVFFKDFVISNDVKSFINGPKLSPQDRKKIEKICQEFITKNILKILPNVLNTGTSLDDEEEVLKNNDKNTDQ
jgi:hypothetical protein